MTANDDRALLDAARQGDGAALDRLLRIYEPRIYRFGLRMCRDAADAEDVLQETLLAAARNLTGFRADAALSTWLYALARSHCIKQRRRGKFEPARAEPLDAAHAVRDPAPLPDEEAARAELAGRLERALRRLDPRHREVLLLRDVEGLTAPEVARVLGLGERAVKSRLHRARAMLRRTFAPPAEPRPAGCPDVEALFSRNLEGELAPAVCARMERHLAGCPHCRGACDALKQTLRVCAGLPGPAVPAAVRERLRLDVDALRRAAARPPHGA